MSQSFSKQNIHNIVPNYLSNVAAGFIGKRTITLAINSFLLYQQALKDQKNRKWQGVDYSYIVLPMTKVFEGYLILLVFRQKLGDKSFREAHKKRNPINIGEVFFDAVNKFKKGIKGPVYNNLKNLEKDKKIPNSILKVWMNSRNTVVHYRIGRTKQIMKLDEAYRHILDICDIINKSAEAYLGIKSTKAYSIKVNKNIK